MNLGGESASGRCPWHLALRSEFIGIAFIPLRCYNNVAHALARLTPVCLIRPRLLHRTATDLPCLTPVGSAYSTPGNRSLTGAAQRT